MQRYTQEGLLVPDYMITAICPHLQHFLFHVDADISFLLNKDEKKYEDQIKQLYFVRKKIFEIPELYGQKTCCEKLYCKCQTRAYFKKRYPFLKYKIFI
jgi:hypothetical protein